MRWRRLGAALLVLAFALTGCGTPLGEGAGGAERVADGGPRSAEVADEDDEAGAAEAPGEDHVPLLPEGRAALEDGHDPGAVRLIDEQASLARVVAEISEQIKTLGGVGSIESDVVARVITVHARQAEWDEDVRAELRAIQDRALAEGITVRYRDVVLGESELMDLAGEVLTAAQEQAGLDITAVSVGVDESGARIGFGGPGLLEDAAARDLLAALVRDLGGDAITVHFLPEEEIEVVAGVG